MYTIVKRLWRCSNDYRYKYNGFNFRSKPEFSKVARLVDECGSAVILKNNVPRYLVIDFSKADKDMIASDDDVLSISKQLMEQNREAYEVLAK